MCDCFFSCWKWVFRSCTNIHTKLEKPTIDIEADFDITYYDDVRQKEYNARKHKLDVFYTRPNNNNSSYTSTTTLPPPNGKKAKTIRSVSPSPSNNNSSHPMVDSGIVYTSDGYDGEYEADGIGNETLLTTESNARVSSPSSATTSPTNNSNNQNDTYTDLKPVVVFVHGGAWISGDKDYWCNIYGNFATQFVQHGMVAVTVSYRLSPFVKHPAHVKDVAKALRWVRNNIQRYGGDPDRVFLCGHSAGGYIVSTLALDGSYLRAEGIDTNHDDNDDHSNPQHHRFIKGVVGISGVYDIERLAAWNPVTAQVVPLHVFGSDKAAHYAASPVNMCRHKDTCPFLLVNAEQDISLEQDAYKLKARLEEVGVPVEMHIEPSTNHLTIVGLFHPNKKTIAHAVSFIQRRCAELSESQQRQHHPEEHKQEEDEERGEENASADSPLIESDDGVVVVVADVNVEGGDTAMIEPQDTTPNDQRCIDLVCDN